MSIANAFKNSLLADVTYALEGNSLDGATGSGLSTLLEVDKRRKGSGLAIRHSSIIFACTTRLEQLENVALQDLTPKNPFSTVGNAETLDEAHIKYAANQCFMWVAA